VPYLSALEVCSRQGAILIHVYLTLPHFTLPSYLGYNQTFILCAFSPLAFFYFLLYFLLRLSLYLSASWRGLRGPSNPAKGIGGALIVTLAVENDICRQQTRSLSSEYGMVANAFLCVDSLGNVSGDCKYSPISVKRNLRN